VRPGNERIGQGLIATASNALETYSKIFGAHPYPSLKVVEVPLPASFSGMDLPGMVALADAYLIDFDSKQSDLPSIVREQRDVIQSALEFTLVHEIAHSWWGGSVGSACKLMEGPNAVVIGSSTANSGPNYNANSRVGIGVYQAASGRNSKSIAQHVYFWNRNLEQAEAQQLYVEPYAFLRPLRKYHFTTAVAPATAVFRRTLSEFGARTGARQVMA